MRWFGCVWLFVLFCEAFGVKNFPQCPRVKFNNGRVKLRQRGRFVEYFCNNGYLRAGERLSICIQGKWDSSPPKCVRPTCYAVKSPPNSLIYPSHAGGVLTFYCKQGFELRGPSVIYCDGKKWDDNSPTCLPSNTKPALSCDFESDDLCHWTHDFNYDFTWTRHFRSTPSGLGSINTGPSHDHTKGENKNGYYMYIESSSRNKNDTARLISPIYDATTTNTCFEFYYHMFGETIGELRVFVKRISQNWTLDPSSAFFVKSGNQGNHWLMSFTGLGAIPEDFQIVIEGVRGDSYESDIAIDDVRLVLDCHPHEIHMTTEHWNNEPVFTVRSCQNRCGESINQTIPNHLITCGCTPSCYAELNCCWDYEEFCVSSTQGTHDKSTTELAEYTTEDTTSFIYPKSTAKLMASKSYHKFAFTTAKHTRIKETTSETTTKTTMQTTVATTTSRKPTTVGKVPTTVSTIIKRPTTINRPTTRKLPEITTAVSTTTATPKTTPSKKRILHRKTLLPIVLTKEFEEGAKKAWYTLVDDFERMTFNPVPTTRKITTKPDIPTSQNPEEDNITEIDEVELPWNNSDEGSFESNPPTNNVDHYEEKKNQIEKEVKKEIDRDFFSKGKHAESMMKAGTSNSGHTGIIIVCTLLLASVVVVGLIVGYRKYRALPYSKKIMRLRRSNHGSQSDVFFLTNEEQLNFTSNYDTL